LVDKIDFFKRAIPRKARFFYVSKTSFEMLNKGSLLALCFSALISVQCNRKVNHFSQKSPEKTALTFVHTVAQENFQKAEIILSPTSKVGFKHYVGILQSYPDSVRIAMNQEALKRIKTVNSTSCQVNGDRATCNFVTKQGKSIPSIILTRIDKRWYVEFNSK
jgi:hypothetical protein